MSYLLDTNTCIAAMRGKESVCARLAALTPDECAISVVSYYELLAGVERCRNPSAERKKVETFVAPLRVLPFDISSAAIAARIRWELEKKGEIIGSYDLLLAGQAVSLDLPLVTHNLREFQRVAGLRVESWE
jgi:tRNA(fMet)-specific endonuclease VapC